MRLFYDTEFLESGPDEPIGLISIGMARATDWHYYAVVKDDDLITRAAANPWLRANVLPSLPVWLADDSDDWNWDANHPDFRHVKRRKDIAEEIGDFILRYPDPELWADWCAYDHVALCQLFGRMIDLPQGVPMWTHEFRQVVERAGNPELPALNGLRAHNALDDALELKMRFEWLAEKFPAAL